MATVSDLIHSSFRLIGAIAAGETLETDELNDAFISLNQMISSWNTEGASLVGRRFLPVTLNVGQIAYLLPERPVQIVSAHSEISGASSPVDIVDAPGIDAVEEIGLQSIYIKKVFCDYLYPTSSIHIWPAPRLAGALYLWILSILNAFASVSDTIDLAPGYEIAIRYNFAVALLPEYPRSQVDPTLPAQAQNYKASIVQLNMQNHMRSRMPAGAQAAVSDVAQSAAR